jgi:DNA-binding transcriptional ArsR family regulator
MEPFAAIADPVRRRIVELLAAGDKTAGELGDGFVISQPAISRHLRVLRDAGLVIARAQAQRRLYRLNPAPLAEVSDWVGRCQASWEKRSDSLKASVESGASKILARIPVRYPGRVSLDLTGWETGRWRSMPLRAPPIDRTAA